MVTGIATEPKLTIKLLSELGPHFPVGQGSAPLKPKKWRLKEEKELGAQRDKMKDANMGRFISFVLGYMYDQFGSFNFSDMKQVEKTAAMSDLPLGNVLYAYVWLRYHVLGHVFNPKLICPACRKDFLFPCDLRTVEIRTAEKLEDAEWIYQLRDPFEIRGKEINSLVIAPVKWKTMEAHKSGNSTNTGEMKAIFIKGSIKCVNGLDGELLTDAELEEMSKFDLEALTDLVDKYAVGPDMAIDASCGNCGHAFRTALDWGYDNFFGISSQ